MDISRFFLGLALGGAGWVLWLLVALSLCSVAVMIERGLWLRRRRAPQALIAALRDGDEAVVADVLSSETARNSVAGAVVAAGTKAAAGGVRAAAEAMLAERARQRREAERLLVVLGTLGSNVPYIGLFGTVLGVIKAFDELGAGSANSGLVMGGISEALVATAVGLLVAVPAVVAYNSYSRRVKSLLAEADEAAHVLLARKEAAHAK